MAVVLFVFFDAIPCHAMLCCAVLCCACQLSIATNPTLLLHPTHYTLLYSLYLIAVSLPLAATLVSILSSAGSLPLSCRASASNWAISDL